MNYVQLPNYILILLILIPTLMYSMLPLRSFFRYSKKRTTVYASISLAAIIIICASMGAATEMSFKITIMISMIPLLAVHLGLSKGKIGMRLFTFFNSAMITGNSLVYGSILAAPFETNGSFLTMSIPTIFSCLAVMLALGIIYHFALTTYIPYLINSEALNLDYRLALSITFFITALFFWVMPEYPTVIMTGRVRATILAFLLLAPGAFMLIYHSMWRVAVNITENTELRESNELMAMQQKRYEELRSYMDETRRLRHDFRQHLLVMDDYAKKGETNKLSDYISQFTESLKEYRSVIAANPALDAVASHYDSMADSQSTHIKWMIELPYSLPVKESDFITIFGNLVENALIAVGDLPEEKRNINVNAKMLSDEMLGLTVKNPYEGEIKLKKNGLPKSDKAGHGIGLTSVKAVVNRYGGAMDISTDDNLFTVGTLIYTKSNR